MADEDKLSVGVLAVGLGVCIEVASLKASDEFDGSVIPLADVTSVSADDCNLCFKLESGSSSLSLSDSSTSSSSRGVPRSVSVC